MINIETAIEFGKALKIKQPKFFKTLEAFNYKHLITDKNKEYVNLFKEHFPNLYLHLRDNVSTPGKSGRRSLSIQCLYYTITIKVKLCEHCLINEVHFDVNKLCERGYCSKTCSNVGAAAVEKRKQGVEARFGTRNYFGSKHFKENKEQIYLNSLGVTHPARSEVYKQNKRENSLVKYGVTHHSKLESYKQNMRENNPMHKQENKDKLEKTNMSKYGFASVLSNNEIKEKIKNSLLKIYGVDNAFKSTIIKDKIKEIMLTFEGGHSTRCPKVKQKNKNTCIAKYGVPYVMQNAEIFEKSNNFKYSAKTYISNNGSEITCRGYEPSVLKWLDDASNIKGVITKPSKMPEINYWNTEREGYSRYYIDAYVKTETNNWHAIEVKSYYTLIQELEKNISKFKAANKVFRKLNQTFWLAVVSKVGEINWIEFPTLGKIKKLYRKAFNQIIIYG